MSNNKKNYHLGMRQCIVTRNLQYKRNLIRFVLGPGNCIIPDIEQKLPGRGFWVYNSWDIINIGYIKNLFSRAAKKKVIVHSALADVIEVLLKQKCLNLCLRAYKLGKGYIDLNKMSSQSIDFNTKGIILKAYDYYDNNTKKIHSQNINIYYLFNSAEISFIFGQKKALYGGILSDSLTEKIEFYLTKFYNFRKK